MNINWKVRFKNKVFWTSTMALIISFVYDILAMLGIMPSVEESTVLALAETVLKILAMLGILADPTTAGISDSAQAMTYLKPKE